MNVAEFREWLATQDQEAIPRVLSVDKRYCVTWKEFNPEDCSTYIDLRNNRFVKESDPGKNVRFLELGCE
jgi:hypothetical protein